MNLHNPSLRTTLSLTALILAGLALAAAGTIVAMTTFLHRASVTIEASTHGVQLAEEAQIDLLLHSQAKSPFARRDLAGSLHSRLSEARSYVGSERELALLDEAASGVNDYVLASRKTDREAEEIVLLQAQAFSALEALVIINVEQARDEARWASRVDYLANIGGLVMALLVLGFTAFFLYWVRGPLIQPVRDLAQAMEDFGRGEHATRARVSGSPELREMADQFNEMAAQIERQRELQRAFLAGVAHDLRNPLNALLLSAEVARADTSLPPEHRARRALDVNARQLRKMDRMISDFLDIAAIEAGQLELRLELRDLREPLRSTAELFAETSNQHEVVLSLPYEPVRMLIDPLRIEQVTVNLISNAIKYSPDGGRVDVHLEPRGDEVVVSVTDRGLGIATEARTRLFEPFRRGASRAGIPGVGLGLFVVHRIVEAHGGRIEVQSSPGEGSTFSVVLPSQSNAP